VRKVANSSRRILAAIEGVSGAKYGYTHAAGYSSVTYVERGGKRIVVAVLGEKSSANLTARMSDVIDAAYENMRTK
jgi:D-alanyl-D-alanine carboxypeptidase